jgi:nucleolar protein 53
MAVANRASSKSSTVAALNSKSNASAIGAPSQRSQPSRKGKRAWRKYVDLDKVEEGLEELRVEERVTGYVF